jgi:hypothetical protein
MELNWVFQKVWATKLPSGLRLWLGVMHYKICNELDGRVQNYWFLSLTICRNMQVGGSARLHILDLLWGNMLCLLIVNMPRMNGCGLARVKILLLKWWLVMAKLMRKTTSSFNLWPYSISWNLVGLWYILGTWKSFLIFWKWKTFA